MTKKTQQIKLPTGPFRAGDRVQPRAKQRGDLIVRHQALEGHLDGGSVDVVMVVAVDLHGGLALLARRTLRLG